MKKIYISIIDYNGKENTVECLDSLEKVKKDNFSLHIIIIDNASKEKFTLDKKYENFEITLIHSDVNTGFSGGHNIGIKYALAHNADSIIILNNDTYVDRNFIVELDKAMQSDSAAGLVGPKIYFGKGNEYHKDRYTKEELGKVIWYAGGIMDWNNVYGIHRGVDEVDKGQYEDLEETDFVSGCCFLINKKTLEKVGLFDEQYFLYYEDSDLNQRVKMHGFKILYVPKAVIWHKNASSAGGSGSPLQDYFINRNRLLFGFTYASFRTKFALFRESIRVLFNGRKWQKRGVIDYYLKKFGKGSYK